MGKMKALVVEVEIMLAQGYDLDAIADMLEQPVDLIEAIALTLE